MPTLKRVSKKKLRDLAYEDGAKVVIKHPEKPVANNDGYDRALSGINAAVKVIRATSELHFSRAEKTDMLIEKLTEKLERNPVPYKITVTKRDSKGQIEEIEAIPQ